VFIIDEERVKRLEGILANYSDLNVKTNPLKINCPRKSGR